MDQIEISDQTSQQCDVEQNLIHEFTRGLFGVFKPTTIPPIEIVNETELEKCRAEKFNEAVNDIAEEQKEIDRQIDNFEATHIFSQEKNAEGKKAHDESVKILKELITPNTHGKVETIDPISDFTLKIQEAEEILAELKTDLENSERVRKERNDKCQTELHEAAIKAVETIFRVNGILPRENIPHTSTEGRSKQIQEISKIKNECVKNITTSKCENTPLKINDALPIASNELQYNILSPEHQIYIDKNVPQTSPKKIDVLIKEQKQQSPDNGEQAIQKAVENDEQIVSKSNDNLMRHTHENKKSAQITPNMDKKHDLSYETMQTPTSDLDRFASFDSSDERSASESSAKKRKRVKFENPSENNFELDFGSTSNESKADDTFDFNFSIESPSTFNQNEFNFETSNTANDQTLFSF